MLTDTTINTDDQPVVQLDGLAIVKGRGLQRRLHQSPDIVIAGNAVNRNAEFAQHGSKVLVGTRTVVLNQITRDDSDISSPVAVLIMREH